MMTKHNDPNSRDDREGTMWGGMIMAAVFIALLAGGSLFLVFNHGGGLFAGTSRSPLTTTGLGGSAPPGSSPGSARQP